MASGTGLVWEEASKTYGDRFTLGPFTLDIRRGVTCLVGPNGAGKTTFFRLAANEQRPTKGKVWLRADGEKHRLGYLPQELVLPEASTPFLHLLHSAWAQQIEPREQRPAVKAALASVNLLGETDVKIRRLSGGMKRRLGIAEAIIHDPALVLLDEPTAGLDPVQRIEVRKTILAVALNRVVIVSTHLVEDVRGLADRVIVLNHGRIAFDGTVKALAGHAADDAPGDTPLERAVASLMTDGRP